MGSIVFLHLLMISLLLPWFPKAAVSEVVEGCPSTCGEININYPFGIGESRCAMNESYVIECNNTLGYISQWKPYYSDSEITSISMTTGEITLLRDSSVRCFNYSTRTVIDDRIVSMDLSGTPFFFSTRNKFMVTGCATLAFLTKNSSTIKGSTAICSSVCPETLETVPNDTCNGIGCCETNVAKGLQRFFLDFDSYYNILDIEEKNSTCSRAFLAEEGTFQFNTSILRENDIDFKMNLPVVLDFAVDKCANDTYNKPSASGVGFFCSCPSGFQGNPYIHDCQDIDECSLKEDKKCYYNCYNKRGSFDCSCPRGMEGNPKEEGGCRTIPLSKWLIGLAASLSSGVFLTLSIGSIVFFYKRSKKNKMKRLKLKCFQENYQLLQQKYISFYEDPTERAKMYTLKEIQKATDHFDSSRIIGDGGHGIVYNGLLSDQRVAAIKLSKVKEEVDRDEFINEIALLSRTYHRNVVELLGCCLETEVPLLVYEFISNGTLSDHIHVPDGSAKLCWDDRLRIATEVTSSIVYIHSASSNTIFHRDLKSANILLDEKLSAKLSDFGASKSMTMDQTHITATVQGTVGYLDPEYYQSGKLTEKSDVYSLGVIFLELLTGLKPTSFNDQWPEERNLISHFMILLKANQADQIFDSSMVNEAEKEELDVVARLTGECLHLKGEERPTMKEIESTLGRIRRSKNKQKGKITREERTHLLSFEIRSNGEHSGSISSRKQNSSGSFLPTQSFLR
ncbi:putative Kinase [Zostera marina]|uniref:Putative Kinase n=1 Tax=Zostera marina TaxID=29655 RepID=A0A0K9P363_ZOSMR|nr:putative Kinase [Zostera marina]